MRRRATRRALALMALALVPVLSAFARPDTVRPRVAGAQPDADWVEATLASLDQRQRVAQMVVAWIDGGETSLDGLVLLCRLHHTLIHQTAWEVRLNPVDKRPEFKPPPESRPLSQRLRGQVVPAGGEQREDEWIRERRPRG